MATGLPGTVDPVARPHGFTLIEVLVVVFITAIVLSFAVLSLRDDPGRRVQTEAERFAALARLATQEAVLQSREIAIELEPGGYRFLVLQNGDWVDPGDHVFRPRALPEDMRLSARIEGEDATLRDAAGREREDHPRIYILSGGEMTPFEVTIRRVDGADAARRVRGDLAGRLEVDD